MSNEKRTTDDWQPTKRDKVERELLRWATRHGVKVSEAAWTNLCYRVCVLMGMCKTRAK